MQPWKTVSYAFQICWSALCSSCLCSRSAAASKPQALSSAAGRACGMQPKLRRCMYSGAYCAVGCLLPACWSRSCCRGCSSCAVKQQTRFASASCSCSQIAHSTLPFVNNKYSTASMLASEHQSVHLPLYTLKGFLLVVLQTLRVRSAKRCLMSRWTSCGPALTALPQNQLARCRSRSPATWANGRSTTYCW